MFEALGARQLLAVVYLALLIFVVCAQTVAWQFVHTRYGRQLIDGGRRRAFEAVVLAFLLSQVIVFGEHLHYISESVMGPAPNTLRWVGWVLLASAAIIVQTRRQDLDMAAVAAATVVVLPVFDLLPRPWPAVAMLWVPSYLGVRALMLIRAHYRALRSGISAMSVQEAVDRLPSGLMFVREDGSVTLINSRMRTVMATLAGRVHRNGVRFLAEVDTHSASAQDDPDSPVFQLADGSHWMLSRSELRLADAWVQQVVATDVSLRWQLVTELRASHAELEATAWQLQAEIDGLLDACTSDELVWARTRTHDVIGQRASALLRLVKSGAQPDRQLLVDIVSGLQRELDVMQPRRTAAEELRLLCTVLDQIGVRVLAPKLPADQTTAMVIVDIIREATSNAIKHGSATEIRAESRRDGAEYVLTICDNGYADSSVITEGGGLSGMRYRLAALNGTLRVDTRPEFKLVAVIPGVGP